MSDHQDNHCARQQDSTRRKLKPKVVIAPSRWDFAQRQSTFPSLVVSKMGEILEGFSEVVLCMLNI